MGRVHRPRRCRAALPLRPDLAHVVVDLHLRQRLPGHRRRPARRRLLHHGRALHRQGRRPQGPGRGGRARRGRVAVPLGRRRWPVDREGGRPAEDPGGRRRLHLPQPARFPCGSWVLAAPARGPARQGAAHPQAGRLLAAADPAHLPHRRAAGRDLLPRDQHHRVRPPGLGAGRPRPGLVLLGQPRGPRRPRAGLPQQRRRAARADGPRGVRRAGGALRGAPEHGQGGPQPRGAHPPAAAGPPRDARGAGGARPRGPRGDRGAADG